MADETPDHATGAASDAISTVHGTRAGDDTTGASALTTEAPPADGTSESPSK